ncbi:hypothetical protein EMPS_07051 [Entomortierella parvispora]|uniref:Uncharacterized protein n=1 Tax=Entomortierella parvispora TaxID=205924 RepID=A0A9P3LY31_9FUNG|nr:hypothetical protein EMPS_07051 [Entomortierella parvispora]
MSSTSSAVTPAPTTYVNPKTPWAKYYCNENTSCPVAGMSCHYNKYCIPELAPGETCLDEKDTVAPFVARVDNVYSLFCDMPEDIKPQTTKCPLGCETWESCHGDICYLKKCTKDQTACKNGQLEMCMGLSREEIICYEAIPHGNTGGNITNPHGGKDQVVVESSGLSSSQVGGIAGGVSAVVVLAMAAGAWFMVRRRRANKAKAAAAAAATGSHSSLPTYYAQDEKRPIPESA